jgi:hypothetical protein
MWFYLLNVISVLLCHFSTSDFCFSIGTWCKLCHSSLPTYLGILMSLYQYNGNSVISHFGIATWFKHYDAISAMPLHALLCHFAHAIAFPYCNVILALQCHFRIATWFQHYNVISPLSFQAFLCHFIIIIRSFWCYFSTAALFKYCDDVWAFYAGKMTGSDNYSESLLQGINLMPL